MGCPVPTIEHHAREGHIKRRPRSGNRPTLNRASVEQFADQWRAKQAARAERRKQRDMPAPSKRVPPEDTGWLHADEVVELTGLGRPRVGQLATLGILPAQWSGHQHLWFREDQTRRWHEARAADAEQWISWRAAADLIGCSTAVVSAAAQRGEIERREANRTAPSLRRSSVRGLRPTVARPRPATQGPARVGCASARRAATPHPATRSRPRVAQPHRMRPGPRRLPGPAHQTHHRRQDPPHPRRSTRLVPPRPRRTHHGRASLRQRTSRPQTASTTAKGLTPTARLVGYPRNSALIAATARPTASTMRPMQRAIGDRHPRRAPGLGRTWLEVVPPPSPTRLLTKVPGTNQPQQRHAGAPKPLRHTDPLFTLVDLVSATTSGRARASGPTKPTG